MRIPGSKGEAMSVPEKPIILCIDDDQSMLMLLRGVLAALKCKVVPVSDCAQAFSFLKHTTPDLILLDIVMPDMNGYDFCSLLQMNPGTSYVPVIFLTALGGSQDRARA